MHKTQAREPNSLRPRPAAIRVDLGTLVFERSEQGRGFLFNPKSGEIFSLNATGAFIVECLRESITPSELARKVAVAFGVEVITAKRDVSEFVEQLRQMDLIRA